MNYRDRHKSLSYSVPNEEYARMQAVAQASGMTVTEWGRHAVRRALQDAELVRKQTRFMLEPTHGTA